MLTRGPYKRNKEIYEKARELRHQGFGYRLIAQQLGDNLSWNTIKNWVRDIPIDVGYAHRLSSDKKRKKFEELTGKNNKSRREHLIRERGHQCEMCSNITWLNNKIPLELDHIDGNKRHNKKENLRLLCPNCHALTDNYKGKNIKK